MARAFLLLGTNQGDLYRNIEAAMKELQNSGVAIKKRSRICKTKPWGKKDQPDFLNVVLEVETGCEPLELLSVIKSIEMAIGRKPDPVRWGPRVIDIDILFFEDRVIETKELTVPHGEFLNRPFAIRLLTEIAPALRYPGTRRYVSEYLEL
ncbi:2-amino-4-hydroxy-6-hydroxymethyldihydropteridine diphosphokinase [candidate division WOR-3 bacterium]|nr:2-amino-4-hydroxy-6-hydroxymethyldihydropteridine diphosphokinase [candidate division WOR-3 bacterium]